MRRPNPACFDILQGNIVCALRGNHEHRLTHVLFRPLEAVYNRNPVVDTFTPDVSTGDIDRYLLR